MKRVYRPRFWTDYAKSCNPRTISRLMSAKFVAHRRVWEIETACMLQRSLYSRAPPMGGPQPAPVLRVGLDRFDIAHHVVFPWLHADPAQPPCNTPRRRRAGLRRAGKNVEIPINRLIGHIRTNALLVN